MTAPRVYNAARAAYEADLRIRPRYHDGVPRRPWDELSPVAQWSWARHVSQPFASREGGK